MREIAQRGWSALHVKAIFITLIKPPDVAQMAPNITGPTKQHRIATGRSLNHQACKARTSLARSVIARDNTQKSDYFTSPDPVFPNPIL